MDNATHLKQKILATTSSIPHSRTHPLKTFDTSVAKVRVKRDDELGFGISGSKLRKYTSLLPYLLHASYQEAVVIGSAHSNHVLGISQLLIENGIKPILFLLGYPAIKRQGNVLLTSLLVPESEWKWISREEWPQVKQIAKNYIQHHSSLTALIPEGACMKEALPGALTLALDILQNEQETGEEFDHVCLDAGTGLSAIATILAFSWLNKSTVLHILLVAGDEPEFLEKLLFFQKQFEEFIGAPLDGFHLFMSFKLYRPEQARAFGSVTSSVMHQIKWLAREEGILTDPIYSAKLFAEAKKIIQKLNGKILIVHSGGALTLMGFQNQLQSILI